MPDGEGEQVDIGQLARSVDARGISDTRVEQADVIGPERMERARSSRLVYTVASQSLAVLECWSRTTLRGRAT